MAADVATTKLWCVVLGERRSACILLVSIEIRLKRIMRAVIDFHHDRFLVGYGRPVHVALRVAVELNPPSASRRFSVYS